MSDPNKDTVRKGYEAKIEDIDRSDRTMVVKTSTDAIDRDGDVVLPEGADLANYEKNPVVMWAHDYSTPPIGRSLWIKQSGNALIAKAQFHEKTDLARQAFDLYAEGYMKAWSIGFIVKSGGMRDITEDDVKTRTDWAGANMIIDNWELLEYSAVPIPANPEALSLAISKGLTVPDAVKALVPEPIAEGKDWNREQRDACEHEAVYLAVDMFIPWTMREIARTEGEKHYSVITGRLADGEKQAAYAMRYPYQDWTKDEAEQHAKTLNHAFVFDKATSGPYIEKIAKRDPVAPPVVEVIEAKQPKPAVVEVADTAGAVAERIKQRMSGRVIWTPNQ